ncbi:MAG: hypothetical protein M3N23_00100, partial [Pseudomonadota bacterium]|nr:hypothetical protein [Pseudomonadota bacterium]
MRDAGADAQGIAVRVDPFGDARPAAQQCFVCHAEAWLGTDQFTDEQAGIDQCRDNGAFGRIGQR